MKGGQIGFIVILVLLMAFMLIGGLGRAKKPELEKAVTNGSVCVVGAYKANMKESKEKEYIVSNHGDILSHPGLIPNKAKSVRDKAVRVGDRRQAGLASCVQCHRSKAKFCDRCHEYVGVSTVNEKTGCFACHFYPDTELEWKKWMEKGGRDGS